MRTAITFGLILGLAGVATAQGLGGKLAGRYTLASGKHGAEDVPRDHLDGSVLIAGDLMTTYDADNKEVYVVQFKVDHEETPARLSMKAIRSSRPDAVGMTAKGLIKVEGDTITLIYDYDGDTYPADFTPDDKTQNLFVLKRRPGETK